MKRFSKMLGILALSLFALVAVSTARSAEVEEGFKPLFDGETLTGWDGNPKFWRVEDGTITGETTKEQPTSRNTFLIWREGKVDDFELRLQYRIRNHNSGVQYRSWEGPGRWVVGGYQADLVVDGPNSPYSGILYEERGRGIFGPARAKGRRRREPQAQGCRFGGRPQEIGLRDSQRRVERLRDPRPGKPSDPQDQRPGDERDDRRGQGQVSP